VVEEDQNLAAFQAALLELLARHTEPGELRRVLCEDPRFEAYRGYVEGFDGRMVGVADALVERWGERGTAGE
jgi:hypothetical protein